MGPSCPTMMLNPWQVRERQTCHADRTYVEGFIERRGMEKNGGESGLWGQEQLKRRV